MARKVIITVALTGAFHGKEANPNLPEQPEEIAQAAYEAYKAGASIAHIHARDKDGKSTNDPKIFSEINRLVRAKCPIIIQNSTAPANVPGTVAEDGLKVLEAEYLPEMCSLDCSLIATSWSDRTFIYEWTRDFLIDAARRMKALNIKPELEVFNPTSIEDVVHYVYPKGVLDDPLSFSFVMGMDRNSQQAMAYSNETLIHLINKVPAGSHFSALAIGKHQLPGSVMTMLMGGNVRVGFEDNVYFRKGELATSNAQLVERVANLAVELGLEVATPEEAREILGIPQL
ncbi:beta-keto acid cleavage family enzyme [Fusibacter ferrireducens]|uniref:3-keto-5-aminohexanoate cleavage protein n=1 Tax=Fusibacter ferrireducens TaxID=2785058 RepID=A0ABR9ZWC3_9FIRM|nr:3-keto-5-aminohexanoate cleavage protein [Fusibacter ferrireducens]MBF4694751.1 3-keto-5-aminohexanoate cleavage protein [Fusibacter ferrireducens]